MLFVFHATVPLFQTAWFIESLVTQTFVVFVIRTRKAPFYRSRPSRPLLLSSLGVIATALVIPFTPVGALFGFVAPPLLFYVILSGLIVTYMVIVEAVKTWFYKRYSHRLEQISMPR
jgi:Mg2+-importing ATPase